MANLHYFLWFNEILVHLSPCNANQQGQQKTVRENTVKGLE